MPRVSRYSGTDALTDRFSVDLIRGSLLLSQPDFRIPDSVPVRFDRFYPGVADRKDPFGPGWSHEHHHVLEIRNGHLTCIDGFPRANGLASPILSSAS